MPITIPSSIRLKMPPKQISEKLDRLILMEQIPIAASYSRSSINRKDTILIVDLKLNTCPRPIIPVVIPMVRTDQVRDTQAV